MLVLVFLWLLIVGKRRSGSAGVCPGYQLGLGSTYINVEKDDKENVIVISELEENMQL